MIEVPAVPVVNRKANRHVEFAFGNPRKSAGARFELPQVPFWCTIPKPMCVTFLGNRWRDNFGVRAFLTVTELAIMRSRVELFGNSSILLLKLFLELVRKMLWPYVDKALRFAIKCVAWRQRGRTRRRARGSCLHPRAFRRSVRDGSDSFWACASRMSVLIVPSACSRRSLWKVSMAIWMCTSALSRYPRVLNVE